jgi:hypothetical protein
VTADWLLEPELLLSFNERLCLSKQSWTHLPRLSTVANSLS